MVDLAQVLLDFVVQSEHRVVLYFTLGHSTILQSDCGVAKSAVVLGARQCRGHLARSEDRRKCAVAFLVGFVIGSESEI